MRFISKTPLDLLIQLGIVFGIGTGLLLFFFYIYLPTTTNHGETLTVPNLEGIPFEEVDEFLTKRHLRYEVTKDSSFTPKYPAHTILQQDPSPNSKVKENRKIYITLNMSRPPSTRMPCLIDGSIKNAQAVLRSSGLRLGEIRYKPALGLNAVLSQVYQNKEYKNCEDINQGIDIPKGSKIDLIAANGLGRITFPAPNLVGMQYSEAEFILIGSGLKLGTVVFEEIGPDLLIAEDSLHTTLTVDDLVAGMIFQQEPGSDEEVRIGTRINLWVAGSREEYEEQVKADSVAAVGNQYYEY